jgi:hypothetical protein
MLSNKQLLKIRSGQTLYGVDIASNDEPQTPANLKICVRHIRPLGTKYHTHRGVLFRTPINAWYIPKSSTSIELNQKSDFNPEMIFYKKKDAELFCAELKAGKHPEWLRKIFFTAKCWQGTALGALVGDYPPPRIP